MNNSQQYPINTGSGGDTVKGAVEKLQNELIRLYTITNGMHKLWAGSPASYPSASPANGDITINTTVSPWQLQVYNDGVWTNIGASGDFATGVDLDQGLTPYVKGVVPYRYSGTVISVPASATAPATVVIPGIGLLQNTSAVTKTFNAEAVGTYKIYAERYAATSTFVIGVTAGTLTSTQVQIGEARWGPQTTGGSNSLLYVVATEHYPALDKLTPGFFRYLRNHAVLGTLDVGQWTTIEMLAQDDIWYQFDSNIDIGYTGWRCRRAGYYEFHALAHAYVSTAQTNSALGARFMKNLAAEGGLNWSSFGTLVPYNLRTAISYVGSFDVGDTMVLQFNPEVTIPGGADLPVVSADTVMWGRYLGSTA